MFSLRTRDASGDDVRATKHTTLSALAAVICAVLLGVCWTVASPIGASPDDDFHLASVWCGAFAPSDACTPSDETLDEAGRAVLVPAAIGPEMVCYRHQPTTSAACQPQFDEGEMAVSRANDGVYPGGFYHLMSVLARDDTSQSVLAMRMLSWLLCLGLIIAAARSALAELRSSYALAVLATSVPLALFLFASNNPSGLVVAAGGAFWIASLALVRGEASSVGLSAAVVIISMLATVISRRDAGIYLIVVAASIIVTGRGWEVDRRRRSVFVGAVAVVAALTVVLRPTSGFSSETSISGQRSPDLLWHNMVNLPSLWVGSLGTWDLGWLDTRMPAIVWVLTMLVLGGLVFAGLRQLSPLKITGIVVILLPIIVVPLVILARRSMLVGSYVQPRYLLPLMVAVVGTVVIAPEGSRRDRLTTGQLVSIGGALTVAHSVALHANLDRYVSGRFVRGFDLDSRSEWWWDVSAPTPMTVWFLGTLAFGVCVAWCLARWVGTDRSDRTEPPGLLTEASDASDQRNTTHLKHGRISTVRLRHRAPR